MCLISLSHVLEVVRSWCIASFAIIVGCYDVSPPLLSYNGLSFPFEVILSDWVFKDLRTLDVCLAWDTRGDNGVFYWFTWCMFWHPTHGFSRWHWGNICIGVDARFRPCFSGRNLGALFEVLCVGLNIMNLKLFDAYRIIDPRILVATLEYLGDIRVGWCVSYGVILVRTLGYKSFLGGMH